jgi:hypothetical protein
MDKPEGPSAVTTLFRVPSGDGKSSGRILPLMMVTPVVLLAKICWWSSAVIDKST